MRKITHTQKPAQVSAFRQSKWRRKIKHSHTYTKTNLGSLWIWFWGAAKTSPPQWDIFFCGFFLRTCVGIFAPCFLSLYFLDSIFFLHFIYQSFDTQQYNKVDNAEIYIKYSYISTPTMQCAFEVCQFLCRAFA